MAVLIPITRPWPSTSGPPELPGLMAASVWTASPTAAAEAWLRWGNRPGDGDWLLPRFTVRCSADTIPALTEPSRPSGEPMASTVSPTCTVEVEPRVAGVRPLTSLARMIARSVAGSRPTMLASAVLPLANLTVIPPAPAEAAASTTWLLVRMVPSERRMTPDPSSPPLDVVTVTETTLGWTAAATCASGSAGALDVPGRHGRPSGTAAEGNGDQGRRTNRAPPPRRETVRPRRGPGDRWRWECGTAAARGRRRRRGEPRRLGGSGGGRSGRGVPRGGTVSRHLGRGVDVRVLGVGGHASRVTRPPVRTDRAGCASAVNARSVDRALAQPEPLDLATRRLRQVGHKVHSARVGVRGVPGLDQLL